MALIIVMATFLIYVAYPLVFLTLGLFGVHFQINSNIFTHLNALLITGGGLAGLRTIEKKLGDVTPVLYTNYKIEKFLVWFNKAWRPFLAYTIIISTFIAYALFPILNTFNSTITLPDNYYESLNALLITGGVLAGLRAVEKKFGLTQIH